MESAFGVEHGEISKGLFGSGENVGRHVAGARKLGFSLKSVSLKSTGGARKGGAHRAGTRAAGRTSFSPFQTGGVRAYQGRHLAGS